MKRNSLTFGAKINCTFAALAAVLALTIWSGFHTAGMLQELLENATTRTAPATRENVRFMNPPFL